jgi:catechol 2,3-dioxygenase-like lactoylglutathione lyase family enzyme
MSEYWNVMVPELTVTDFEGSLSFYTDILGFKIRNTVNSFKKVN